MPCESCTAENPEHARFCLECGAQLGHRCAACGAESPARAKFCLACGKPLATASELGPPPPDPRSYTPKHLVEKILTSRSALEGERKHVTVLFADVKRIVGRTAPTASALRHTSRVGYGPGPNDMVLDDPLLSALSADPERAVARARRALLLVGFVLVFACGRRSPELVREPAEKPSAVAIRNVAILDVARGERLPGRDVIVVGDRIRAVAPAGQTEVPRGAMTIDGAGATLLPGLIDIHAHVLADSWPPGFRTFPDPDANLRAYLYCGVTTVLDPADMPGQIFPRRQSVAARRLLGPRIYAAGPMVTAPGGHPIPVFRVLAPWWLRWYLIPRATIEVDSAEAGRKAADDVKAMGADFVKVAVDRIPDDCPIIGAEALTALGSEAKRIGLRLIAHIGTTADALAAARAGAAAWMHGVYRERIPDEKIGELAAFGIPMAPTMVVFESYALLFQQKRIPTDLERETNPADVLAGFEQPAPGVDLTIFRDYFANLRAHRDDWRDNVRRLHRAGVTILAGSDAQTSVFPGAGLHRELALLVESGLTPAEAVRSATIDPARFLAGGKEPEFGIIAEGKIADLLLVEGDPTKDIAAVSRIRAVVKGGVPLERIALGAR